MQIFCKENFSLPFFFNLYINPKAGNPSAACFSNSSYATPVSPKFVPGMIFVVKNVEPLRMY